MYQVTKKMWVFFIFKIKFYLLTILNYIIPKSENKVFIFDKKFKKDNVWSIGQYLSENDEYNEYEIYYYTKSNIPSKNNIKYISNGLLALWMQLRSKYVFYSYRGDGVISFKSAKGQVIIDTMHGSPLKNIGYMASNSKFNRLWSYEKTFNYILCASDFFKDIIKKSFGAKEDQCLVLGYPRNDIIFEDNNVLDRLNISKESFSKIILWLPTWRTNVKEDRTDGYFPILNLDNINYINNFLLESDTLLIIKPHPFQLDLDIFDEERTNIKIFKNDVLEEKDIELYQLFEEVDALMTDYSSVYFDFLLTMKPIGFTIDDFHKYKDKRGFVVDDPLDIMPGEKITNVEELITFINNIKKGKDEFLDDRKAINNLANKYQDDKSTKRILEYLEIKPRSYSKNV